MPNWRKAFYSVLFFFMVAAAEMGNIIGKLLKKKESLGKNRLNNKDKI